MKMKTGEKKSTPRQESESLPGFENAIDPKKNSPIPKTMKYYIYGVDSEVVVSSMSSSCTWHSKTLITPRRRRRAHKPTVFVSDSTRLYCKSFIRSHFKRSYTNRSSNFSKMSINGSNSTTQSDHTVAVTVSEKLRDKQLKIRSGWPNQKCSTNSYSPVRNLGNFCQIKYWLLQVIGLPIQQVHCSRRVVQTRQ